MNGASASTAVASDQHEAEDHRNTASGTSQRLPDSLRHNPRDEIAQSTRRPIQNDQAAPHPAAALHTHDATRSFMGIAVATPTRAFDRRRSGDQDVDAAAAERRVAFERASHDRLAGDVERGVEQHRYARVPSVRLEQRVQRGAMSRSSTCTRAVPSTCVTAASCSRHSGRTGNTPDMKRAEPCAAWRQVEITVGHVSWRRRAQTAGTLRDT